MNQEEIAAMFRAGELQRRKARHEQLLRNEAELQHEQLTPADKKAHATAVENLREYSRALDKEIRGGYWSRLWAALLGR